MSDEERPTDRALWAVAEQATGCTVSLPCPPCLRERDTVRAVQERNAEAAR